MDHYRKKEYDEALAEAKRINAFETSLVAFSLVAAAGQLGRADEATAAFEALDHHHAKGKQLDAARVHWTLFLRDDELIDRLVEGFEKARALVAEPATLKQLDEPKKSEP